MSEERESRYESGEDLANEILKELEQKEVATDKAHPFSFYLYLPGEEAARKCADGLNLLGLDTEVSEAEEEDGAWLCLATATMEPNHGRLVEIGNRLLELESEWQGELDGWEVNAMSLEEMFESLSEHFQKLKEDQQDLDEDEEDDEEDLDEEGILEVEFDEELSPEADAYLEEACEELNSKQTELQARWNIDSHVQWSFEQESGQLILGFEGGRVLTSEAQILGSFHPEEQTWEWAWNNPHVDSTVAKDSKTTRAIGEEFGIKYLTEGRLPVDSEDLVAFLCAIGLKATDAEGIFTADSDGLRVYLTLRNIGESKK